MQLNNMPRAGSDTKWKKINESKMLSVPPAMIVQAIDELSVNWKLRERVRKIRTECLLAYSNNLIAAIRWIKAGKQHTMARLGTSGI